MSIVQIHVNQERGLVAVDTLVGSARPGMPRAWFEASKLLAIPHLHAVVAVSGNHDLLGQVYGRMVHQGGNFDEVCNSVITDGLVDQACAILEEQAAAQGFEILGRQLVVLVGLSPWTGRVRAVVAERHCHGEPFKVGQLGKYITDDVCLVAPAVENADPSSLAAMLDTARHQVEEITSEHPEVPIGGRLIVAEIRRDQITTSAHEIPAPAAAAALRA